MDYRWHINCMIIVGIKTNCHTVVEEQTADSSIGRARIGVKRASDLPAEMDYQSTSMLGKAAIGTKTIEDRLAVVVGNSNSFKVAYDKMPSFGVSNSILAIVEKPNLARGVFSLRGHTV